MESSAFRIGNRGGSHGILFISKQGEEGGRVELLIEIRHYTYYPKAFRPFLKYYEEEGFAITSRHLGETIGIMTGISGIANRTFQFFAYKSYEHRIECRQGFLKDPVKQKFTEEGDKAIITQESIVIEPTDFSPLLKEEGAKPLMCKEDGTLRYFDLTTFYVKPGKRQEALELFRTGLAELYREYFAYEVGYFTRHYGDVDAVLGMWGFDTEQQRMDQIAELERDERYQKLSGKLFELVEKRESQLLQPTAYSPLR